MTDSPIDNDADMPTDVETFETDDVQANQAIENGQGVGARELAAQRDAGGMNTADDDDLELENGLSAVPGEDDEGDDDDDMQDEDDLDDSLAVQGVDDQA